MIEIIPAIDIIEGKAVRLKMGNYSQKTVYNDNPVEVAKIFEAEGIKRLHIVDLDGAKAKHVVNLKVLENIASETDLVIDFGGGIKSDTDIENVFNSGAAFATIGSIAVQEPDFFENWLNKYGNERIILGADFKEGKIAISGWYDITDIPLNKFIKDYLKKGIQTVLCTDISKDGMLTGSSIKIYKQLKNDFPDIKIIASGGISSVNEIDELDNIGIYGVIIGKAYYEGIIKLNELFKYI